MDLRQLDSFVAVMPAGSITARVLNRSQPAALPAIPESVKRRAEAIAADWMPPAEIGAIPGLAGSVVPAADDAAGLQRKAG
jgi:hypothetical protein